MNKAKEIIHVTVYLQRVKLDAAGAVLRLLRYTATR